MSLYEEVGRHGGIVEIRCESVIDYVHPNGTAEVLGWTNVIICHDGHRIYPTPLEERLIREGPPLPRGYLA